MSIHGAVIAGGAASRYGGSPKGLFEVGGRRILDRAVESLERATGLPPMIIANAPDAASWLNADQRRKVAWQRPGASGPEDMAAAPEAREGNHG